MPGCAGLCRRSAGRHGQPASYPPLFHDHPIRGSARIFGAMAERGGLSARVRPRPLGCPCSSLSSLPRASTRSSWAPCCGRTCVLPVLRQSFASASLLPCYSWSLLPFRFQAATTRRRRGGYRGSPRPSRCAIRAPTAYGPVRAECGPPGDVLVGRAVGHGCLPRHASLQIAAPLRASCF